MIATRIVAAALGMLLASSALAQETATPAPTTATAGPSFTSKEDGWFDMSEFLDEKYGFLPIAVPITEPAVGYGAAGAVMFLSKPLGAAKEGLGRPDISIAGGLGTENGTWAAFVGDMRYWLDERIQTQAGVITANINLKFYGLGKDDGDLSIHPIKYNIETTGSFLQGRFRPLDLPLWFGLGYAFAHTEVDFDLPQAGGTTLPRSEHTEDLAAALPAIVYDNRNNFFTPSSGGFYEAKVGVFSSYLGGDSDFQRLQLCAIHYVPLLEKLTLGMRVDADTNFGHSPFYLNPYVDLRGAPAFQYQGESAASLETELRWQVWGRWSLVGFVGAGAAWNDFEEGDDARTVVTGGGGFRYEIARGYGIHMGLDLAFGPDGFAIYVQVGSAWARA